MSLIFMDSFDHYGPGFTLPEKWTGATANTQITLGVGRTGAAACQILAGTVGCAKTFAQTTNLLACTNWYCTQPGLALVISNLNAINGVVGLVVLGNGDVQVINTPFNVQYSYGQAGKPGLVSFGVYNNIALQVVAGIANGVINVWVNGVQVMHLTGVNTIVGGGPGPYLTYYETVYLCAPGNSGWTCYHDDVYMLDCTDGDTYRGAARIYAVVPYANSTPVEWTPLANQNWQEVSTIPPPGDSSYVSSSTVGNVDQYLYLGSVVPAGAAILGVQHCLDMRVDGGSRSVASDMAGIVAAGQALPSGYAIFTTPYDKNPATAAAWQAADFPLAAGPAVTA